MSNPPGLNTPASAASLVTADLAISVHTVVAPAVPAAVFANTAPPRLPPPSSAPASPAYSTVEPAFCAATAPLAGPPAASDRTLGFTAPLHAAFCGPPSIALMLFEPGHAEPLAAGPRHTLHVPITTSLAISGSSSSGGSLREASPSPCAWPIRSEERRVGK